MPKAVLKIDDREIAIGDGVASFGRSSENTAAFPEDSNVSRFHAEIEKRGDDYWLIDLGSSNGTTRNGQKVESDVCLKDGDTILLGGTSKIKFEFVKEQGAGTSAPNVAAPIDALPDVSVAEGTPNVAATPQPESSNKVLLVAGGVGGLAVVCVLAAGIFYYTRGSKCEARAVISKPEAGDTIQAPTKIEVDADATGCVSRAVFTIDGVEFASTGKEPFTATIDPKEFPDLADGFDHTLQIVLIDENGEQIAPSNPVTLAFETRAIKPSGSPEIAQGNTQQTRSGTKAIEVSLLEIQEMSKRFVKEFGGNFTYNVSNKQFLQEVQKKTGEYAQEGYFDRAARYRDVINVAYVREQNLDAPLGFMLAMSRSKFVPDRQGGEGLWKMTNDFATANGYNGLCGTETLSDPLQNCAAKAAALYMKAIVFGVFDGDAIYSAAAFGKSPQDASVWKATLPANRADIWNSIRTPQEREQVVRFFAAGIVTENPQKFGLNKDRPLSELYRITM